MTAESDDYTLTKSERDFLLDAWSQQGITFEDMLLAVERTLERRTASSPGWFWTPGEWAEWSNELASMIPEDDVSKYANPEGAQESIIEDCLRAYVSERSSTPGEPHDG